MLSIWVLSLVLGCSRTSANDSSSSSTSLRCCSSSDSFTMALLVFLPSYFHIRQARKQNQQQTSGRKLDGLLNSLRFQERAFTKFLKRLLKLLLGVSLRLAHTMPPAPRAAYQTPGETGYHRHRLARQLHHHCRRARVNDCQPLQEGSYPTTGSSQ